MLLLLPFKVKCRLNLVTEPLVPGRRAVAAILLLVHVSGAATLSPVTRLATSHSLCSTQTYTGVKLVLCSALVDFWHKVDGATTFVRLWVKTWGDSNVASTSASSREFSINGFSLNTFANYSTVCIDSDVGTDVTSACN